MRSIRFAEKVIFLFIILNLIIHDFLHDFNASKMSARLSRISSEIQQIVLATASGGAGEKKAATKKPPPLPPASAASAASAVGEVENDDPIIDATNLRDYEDFGIMESGTEINTLTQYIRNRRPRNQTEFETYIFLDADGISFEDFYKIADDDFFTGSMTRSRVKVTQMAKQIIDEIKLFVIGYANPVQITTGQITTGQITTGGRVLNHTRKVKDFDFEDTTQIYKPTSNSKKHSKGKHNKKSKRRQKQTHYIPKGKSVKTRERSKSNSKNDHAIQFIINGIDTAIHVFGNYEVNVNGEIHLESDVKMQNLLEIMKRLFLMYVNESNGLTPFDVFNLPQIEDLLILHILTDNLSNSEINEPSLLFLAQMYYKLHTEDSAELNRLRYEFHGIPLEPSAKMSGGATLAEYKNFIETRFGDILNYYYTPEESNVNTVISRRPEVEELITRLNASEIKDCFKPKKIESAKTAIQKASSKYVPPEASSSTRKRATTDKKNSIANAAYAKSIADLVGMVYIAIDTEEKKSAKILEKTAKASATKAAKASAKDSTESTESGKLSSAQSQAVQKISVLIAKAGIDIILAEDKKLVRRSHSSPDDIYLLSSQYDILYDIAVKQKGFSTLDTNIREHFTRHANFKSRDKVIQSNAKLAEIINKWARDRKTVSIINNAATPVLNQICDNNDRTKNIHTICPTSSVCDAMGATGSCAGTEFARRRKEFHNMEFQLIYGDDENGENYTGQTIITDTGTKKSVKVVYNVLCNDFNLPHSEIEIDISTTHVLTLSANNTFKNVIVKILKIWSRVFSSSSHPVKESDYWAALENPGLFVELATVSTQKGVGDFYQEINSAAQFGGYEDDIIGIRDELRIGLHGDQPSGVRGAKMVLDGILEVGDKPGEELKDHCIVGYAGDTAGTTIMVSRHPLSTYS